MSVFADNLIYFRKITKLSQQEFADRIGVSQAAYGNYEAGTREPSFDKLLRIARVLNVTPNDLLLLNKDITNTDKTIFKELDTVFFDSPFKIVEHNKYFFVIEYTQYQSDEPLPYELNSGKNPRRKIPIINLQELLNQARSKFTKAEHEFLINEITALFLATERDNYNLNKDIECYINPNEV